MGIRRLSTEAFRALQAVVRGRKLPAQRELQREVDHLDQAEQAAKAAAIHALHMAVAMGAPVEFVLRIGAQEIAKPIHLTRTGDNRYTLEHRLEITSTCSGDFRGASLRVSKGGYELPVQDVLSEPSTLRTGDTVHIHAANLRVRDGDNT